MIIDQYPYTKPDNLHQGNFYTQNHRLRYGYMPANDKPLATALMMGGQASFLEEFYETLRDLSEMQVQTYYLESFGIGGSDRQFPDDYEKPPVTPAKEHAQDVNSFVQQVIKPSDAAPFISISYCYSSFVNFIHMSNYPNTFDHAFMVSPMLGMRHHRLDSLDREITFASRAIDGTNVLEYIGATPIWTLDGQKERADKNGYSHDDQRKYITAEWCVQNETLRMGGYTVGNGIIFMRDLTALVTSKDIEHITTPVTIFSGDADSVVRPSRHREFADRLPNGRMIEIPGAGHSILQEKDEFRNVVIQNIASKVKAMSHVPA